MRTLNIHAAHFIRGTSWDWIFWMSLEHALKIYAISRKIIKNAVTKVLWRTTWKDIKFVSFFEKFIKKLRYKGWDIKCSSRIINLRNSRSNATRIDKVMEQNRLEIFDGCLCDYHRQCASGGNASFRSRKRREIRS